MMHALIDHWLQSHQDRHTPAAVTVSRPRAAPLARALLSHGGDNLCTDSEHVPQAATCLLLCSLFCFTVSS